MNIIDKLQVAIFRRDTQILTKIELNNNLDNYFDSKDNTDIVALMYYGMKNNVLQLGNWINVVRNRKIDELEESIVDHYEGIYFALKGDLNSARKFIEKSYSYMSSKRKKIIIDEVNYGMDYKGMVMADLATTYLHLGRYVESRLLYEKANTIFYYRTNNRNRSYRCMFDLGLIELKLHNVWQAKVYFRNVERAKIEDLKVKVAMNLSFVYYLLRDYSKSMERIKALKSQFDVLTNNQKVYLMLTEALVKSIQGKNKEVQELFVLIDEDINTVKDKALLMIYKLQKIIVFKKVAVAEMNIIRTELIPFFIDTNRIQYMAMAVEYLKKVEGGE